MAVEGAMAGEEGGSRTDTAATTTTTIDACATATAAAAAAAAAVPLEGLPLPVPLPLRSLGPFSAATGVANLKRQREATLDVVRSEQAVVVEEESISARWALENKRRRHNYVPFLVSFIKMVKQNGKLHGLITNAHRKAHTVAEARRCKVELAKEKQREQEEQRAGGQEREEGS